VVTTADHVDRVSEVLAPYACGDLQVDRHVGRVLAPTRGGAKALRDVLADLEPTAVEVRDVGLRRPTLDDVFLSLTGHKAEGNGNGNGDGDVSGDGAAAEGAGAEPSEPLVPVTPTDAAEEAN
jgi:ABC-2 type transport system ATP-binding protein